jgi:hypothetical protein
MLSRIRFAVVLAASAAAPLLLAPAHVIAQQSKCGTAPRCYDAGQFIATIMDITPSQVGRHHVLKVNVRFQNTSNQNLTLAYAGTTSGAVDNNGTQYYWGRAGTYDMSATGIGTVQGRKSDPQFVLSPGEWRNATFTVIRYNAYGGTQNPIGNAFTYDVAINELNVLSADQIRTVRQHSLHFPASGNVNVATTPQTPAAPNAAAPATTTPASMGNTPAKTTAEDVGKAIDKLRGLIGSKKK